MVWQAYFDESFDDGVFVIAGYLASPEQWASFSAEWENALPSGVLDNDDGWHFKMSQMAATPERMERVPGFYNVIKDHVGMGIASWMPLSALKRAQKRILIQSRTGDFRPISGPLFDNPYIILLANMLTIFGSRTDADLEFGNYVLERGAKIDLFFDERGEKGKIIAAWEYALENPDIAKRFSATPRFESDGEFLPLQAADFYAWWVRRWTLEGRSQDKSINFPWGASESEIPSVNIGVLEDQLFTSFVRMAKAAIDDGDAIIDRKRNAVIYRKQGR